MANGPELCLGLSFIAVFGHTHKPVLQLPSSNDSEPSQNGFSGTTARNTGYAGGM